MLDSSRDLNVVQVICYSEGSSNCVSMRLDIECERSAVLQVSCIELLVEWAISYCGIIR